MTYQEIKEIVGDKALPQVGENENGERVIIEVGRDENGAYYTTTVSQDNGWLRINRYYENGDYEEEYRK